jgi:hypothetical protein
LQSSSSWKIVEVPVSLDKDNLSEAPLRNNGRLTVKRVDYHGSLKIKLLSVVRRLLGGPLPPLERALWLLVSLYVASL